MKNKLKSAFALILALASVLCLCSCAKSETAVEEKAQEATVQTLPTVLNTNEYVLYQNIFFNNQGADYDGKPVTKAGTFATVFDMYNGVERYYVWGYNDQTKCCDWQWEIKPDEQTVLPSNGSLVEVSGTFASSANSLDGYWIENPQIKVKTEYQGPECDVDMSSMSATLERVQIINIQQFPDKFEGKTVCAYGRIYSPSEIQHPYYDNVWTQAFTSKDTVPAIGTVVVVFGTMENGTIANSTVTQTSIY